MIADTCLTSWYTVIHYWQTLFLGASIKGSLGLLAFLFWADFKKNISSRQCYLFYIIVSISMIIMPVTSHVMLKKKIENWTFQVALDESVSLFKLKQPHGACPTDKVKMVKTAGCHKPVPPDTTADLHVFWSMIWLAGVLLVGLRILGGFYAIRKIVKNSIQIDHDSIREIKQALKIHRDVRVIVSRDITIPSTVGILRPKIIVPERCCSWPAEQWTTVLYHEMYHIRRYDSLLNILIRTICALHWYNPLVWMMASEFSEERETSCDQFVVKSGIKPYRYAKCLLEIIKGGAGFGNATRVAMGVGRLSKIEKRIRRILSFKITENEGIRYPVSLWCLFIGVIICLSIFKVNFIFKENSPSAEIKYENGLVSFTDTANAIEIENVPVKDIPSYWPLGAKWEGPVYTFRQKGERQVIVLWNRKTARASIYAAADGVVKDVTLSESSKKFATITIQHKNNLSTSYTYATVVLAKPGDIVKKGELIAKGTGYWWMAFSVNYKTKPIDPMPFLSLQNAV